MARVTSYFCDYSSQVPQHQAHFHLRSDDKEADLGVAGVDSCSAHLCQLVEDWFRTEDTVRQLVVRRIPDAALPPRGALPSYESGQIVPCEHPGCERSFRLRTSMKAHMRRDHPVTP